MYLESRKKQVFQKFFKNIFDKVCLIIINNLLSWTKLNMQVPWEILNEKLNSIKWRKKELEILVIPNHEVFWPAVNQLTSVDKNIFADEINEKWEFFRIRAKEILEKINQIFEIKTNLEEIIEKEKGKLSLCKKKDEKQKSHKNKNINKKIRSLKNSLRKIELPLQEIEKVRSFIDWIIEETCYLNPYFFSEKAISLLNHNGGIIRTKGEKTLDIWDLLERIFCMYKVNEWQEVPKIIKDIIDYLTVLLHSGKKIGYIKEKKNNKEEEENPTSTADIIQWLIVSIVNLHTNILEVFCATLEWVNQSLKEQLAKNS